MDHAPGPISAKAAPRVASMIQHDGCPDEKTFHSASAATSVPATGVHSPASRSNPKPIESD